MQGFATKYFSDIPNKDVGNPEFPGGPYPQSHLGKMLEVVPIKENRSLDLHFPLPPTRQHYSKKPANYISHLIGHESAGSIISYLKKKNWANDLWGGQARSCSDWASFQVGCDLTEEGMEHVEEVRLNCNERISRSPYSYLLSLLPPPPACRSLRSFSRTLTCCAARDRRNGFTTRT